MEIWPVVDQATASKLTRYTDYSVRALIYLAQHNVRHASVAEMAKAYGISQNIS